MSWVQIHCGTNMKFNFIKIYFFTHKHFTYAEHTIARTQLILNPHFARHHPTSIHCHIPSIPFSLSSLHCASSSFTILKIMHPTRSYRVHLVHILVKSCTNQIFVALNKRFCIFSILYYVLWNFKHLLGIPLDINSKATPGDYCSLNHHVTRTMTITADVAEW
jgi:hypothetical protein